GIACPHSVFLCGVISCKNCRCVCCCDEASLIRSSSPYPVRSLMYALSALAAGTPPADRFGLHCSLPQSIISNLLVDVVPAIIPRHLPAWHPPDSVPWFVWSDRWMKFPAAVKNLMPFSCPRKFVRSSWSLNRTLWPVADLSSIF